VPIPIYSQFGLLYHIPVNAVAHYRARPNAEVKTRRGAISSIFLHDHGSDYDRPSHHGYDRDMIHSHETDTNPPRVWEHKRQCPE